MDALKSHFRRLKLSLQDLSTPWSTVETIDIKGILTAEVSDLFENENRTNGNCV